VHAGVTQLHAPAPASALQAEADAAPAGSGSTRPRGDLVGDGIPRIAADTPSPGAPSTTRMADKVREVKGKVETKWKRFIDDRDPKINQVGAALARAPAASRRT
jgi:hypothetical protein